MTLRKKLTWLVTLLIVSILLANLLVVRREYRQTLEKNFDQRMTTIGSAVGLMILPDLLVGGGNINEKLGEVGTLFRKTTEVQDDIAEIAVYDAEMNPLQSYLNPKVVGGAEDLLEKSFPIQVTKVEGGQVYGYVKVKFHTGAYEQAQLRVLSHLMIIGLLFSLAGLGASFLMAQKITRPIEHLTAGAVEFGKKKYETRVKVEARDEIGLLAETFNEMAASIDRQFKKISLLQEWSREVASELDQHRAIDTVVRAFADLGGVSKMSVMFYNEATSRIEIVGGVGLHPDAVTFLKLQIGEGIAGKVLETGKIMRVSNISQAHEYKSFSGETALRGSLIALPLIAKGKCFGVVNLHEKTDGTEFDSSDESILTTLAEIAAVAFENARLYDMAITDGLTRLFIVRYFHQRMGEEITRTHRTSRPLSLIMADIDHFKSINDTYGHQTGDAVLVALARVIRRVFREIDIPCRYGGEEFAIILPDTDKAGSLIVGERFREAVENFIFATNAGDLKVTISIGMATYTLGRTKDDLIHEADTALYASKRKGRNLATHFVTMS